MAKKQGFIITKNLVIAALALRCPNRTDTNPIYARCDRGGGVFTNCNPRLCTMWTDFAKDMARIKEEGIDNYI